MSLFNISALHYNKKSWDTPEVNFLILEHNKSTADISEHTPSHSFFVAQVHKLFFLTVPQLLRKEIMKKVPQELIPHCLFNIITPRCFLFLIPLESNICQLIGSELYTPKLIVYINLNILSIY